MKKRDFKKSAIKILINEYHIDMNMYKAGKVEQDLNTYESNYICFTSKTKRTRINFTGESQDNINIDFYNVCFS